MFQQRFGNIIAQAVTNCEDDLHWRVRLKSPKIWTEENPSALIPSVGHYGPIHIAKDDFVIVSFQYGFDNAFIVGKFANPSQVTNQQRSQYQGLLLWESSYGDSNEQWQQVHVAKQTFFYENSDGVQVLIEPEGKVTVKATNIYVETVETINYTIGTDANINVKGNTNITIEGDVTETVNGNVNQTVGGDVSQTVSGNVNSESSSATVKATDITLDGKVTFTHNFGPPDGQGPLCSLNSCLFSGAPHSSKATS